MVGTRKGLFLLRGDQNRSSWSLEGPLLTGWSVLHAIQVPRDGSLYFAGNNFVYGAPPRRPPTRAPFPGRRAPAKGGGPCSASCSPRRESGGSRVPVGCAATPSRSTPAI